MALKLFNTYSRKKETFKPIEEGKVCIYSCGPTVYDFVHIGNLRAFMFSDILRRYLKYAGFNIVQVMNITDVDDKTIKNAKKSSEPLQLFTKRYTQEFIKDIKTLNIELPEQMVNATDHIHEMVQLIEKLHEKGLAYEKKGSVYYKIAAFKNYGKLAGLDLDNLKVNAEGRLSDADEYEKDNVRDFALWKAYDPDDGNAFWGTPYGKGRPGWHIECSAMSMKYLGEHFDIHTGGVDLIFPHHTNEIAQSEAATGKKFVNYWLHNAHLIVNGEKMSKSLGNFYTLRDLLKKGYNPIAIRYELLSTHYRQQLNFKEDNLKQIPATLQRFYEFLDKLDDAIKQKGKVDDSPRVQNMVDHATKQFEKAMDDDLNISGGLAAVFDLMRKINTLLATDAISPSDARKTKVAMLGFDSVLGVMHHEKGHIDEEIEALIEKREKAREKKNFKLADKIRDDLLKQGIQLDDTLHGAKWKRIA
ncbi:cysteine--tRNA ligase [Candidatus Woesearchaeota archaeon]|nr:cysteine--tRNA ligase [Candidatus Woesearchaeota archaeon]